MNIDTDLISDVLEHCVRNVDPFKVVVGNPEETQPEEIKASLLWIELLTLMPLIGLVQAQDEDPRHLVRRVAQIEAELGPVQIEDMARLAELGAGYE